MDKIINENDIIYIVYPPNGHIKNYRYYKCKVTNIQKGWGLEKTRPGNRTHYSTYNLKDLKQYEDLSHSQKKCLLIIGIEYKIDDKVITNFIQLNKDMDKLYLEDELDIVKQDVDNLNKILELKTKQKEELNKYIKELLISWNYRGKDTLLK